MVSNESTSLAISRHADARLRQRGIQSEVIRALLAFGEPISDGRGGTIFRLSRDSQRELRAEIPRADFARLERYADVYAVVSGDDTLITAAHATRRFRAH